MEAKILSQLSIGNQLYRIKDSALTTTVNNLSTQVDNHGTQIYALQQALGGLDSTTVAALEKITQELQGEENDTTKAFVTLVDKLKGLGDDTVASYVRTQISGLASEDFVDEKITAFATEDLYYGSTVENVFVSNDESLNYNSSTETLSITTAPFRLLAPDTGSGYVKNS